MTGVPPLTRTPAATEAAVAAARAVARVAAEHAERVDRQAAFPAEAVSALADAGLLAAVVPASSGGLGLEPPTLARIASTLARGCGSTAMIWAMHQLQLACVAWHGGLTAPVVADLVAELVTDNRLLASVTSEKGIGGDITRSAAAVRADPAGCLLVKDAPTVSYADHAGAFLITLRRDPAAAADDQVAALVRADQLDRTRTGPWNPMGMRGTCSPGFLLRARFDAGQILPEPFGVIARRTLIPLSEILWSAVWIGLATEALHRAAGCLHARAGRSSGPVVDRRLAVADQIVTGLDAQLSDAVVRFDAVRRGGQPGDRRFRMRLNALKLAASTATVEVAQHALAICGFAGYQEEGPYSVARIMRDLYSAQIMVSNDRLLDSNAEHAVTLWTPDSAFG